MQEENIITQVMAVWGWQIIAIQFLIAGLMTFLMVQTTAGLGLFATFIFGCLFCTIKSWLRRKKLLESGDEKDE